MAITSLSYDDSASLSQEETRNYYPDHIVTLARHPSENDEHMMVRLVLTRRRGGTGKDRTYFRRWHR